MILLEQLSGGVFAKMWKTAEEQILGEENKNPSLNLRHELDIHVNLARR